MEIQILLVLVGFILLCMSPYLYIRFIQKDKRPMKEIFEEERIKNLPKVTLVKVEVIGHVGPRAKDPLARAFIGAALGGEIGAALGGLSGWNPKRGKTTFRLYYADGHTKDITLTDGYADWREYMEKAEQSASRDDPLRNPRL